MHAAREILQANVNPVDSVPIRITLVPGTVVDGRYRIEACLGAGGMASVYRATHVPLDQQIAIKVVSPQVRTVPGMAQRFLREARAATRLKNEHVVRVFDVGRLPDGAPYMVMEHLEGRDLDGVLEAGRDIPVESAIDYILQTCEALAEVHGHGIVHRDLKPANLFVTRGADGRPLVKLIDFGISRIDAPLDPKDLALQTEPGAMMGSPPYMSPEQMQSAKHADLRSDIYGLGAVLYELLTRRTPHEGESLLELFAGRATSPPPPSTWRKDIPSKLDEAILKCLRFDPNERFGDAAELAFALAPFGPEGSLARAEQIERIVLAAQQDQPSRRQASNAYVMSRRHRRRIVGGVAIAAAAAALMLWTLCLRGGLPLAIGDGAHAPALAPPSVEPAGTRESAPMFEPPPAFALSPTPKRAFRPREAETSAGDESSLGVNPTATATLTTDPAPEVAPETPPVKVIRHSPARNSMTTDDERTLFEERK